MCCCATCRLYACIYLFYQKTINNAALVWQAQAQHLSHVSRLTTTLGLTCGRPPTCCASTSLSILASCGVLLGCLNLAQVKSRDLRLGTCTYTGCEAHSHGSRGHAGVGVAGILALALGAASVTLTDYGSQVDIGAECVALSLSGSAQVY